MKQPSTFNKFSALNALRFVNKVRPCAKRGDCAAFVRHTTHLDCDVHDLVEAMQRECKHGT